MRSLSKPTSNGVECELPASLASDVAAIRKSIPTKTTAVYIYFFVFGHHLTKWAYFSLTNRLSLSCVANHQHWCWQTGWLIEVKSCAVLSGPFYCKHVKLQLACTFSRDCSVTPRFISDRAEEVRMARWPPPTVTVYWGSKLFPKHLWKLTWVWNAQLYSKVVSILHATPTISGGLSFVPFPVSCAWERTSSGEMYIMRSQNC